ncbi:MAG: Type 1 glutamine amidotransferase-like domain-containing protein [Anaerolineae bacterium]|nr:Type 1 glutamine amidotransferase-like domain-containing protein [Anaerolineae bacterium]
MRTLFLLGGSAVFDPVFDEFVPLAGGPEAEIALLMQGGSNWQKYVPGYADAWLQRGVKVCHPVVPGESGHLDVECVLATLRRATGIMIGGGHTPTYHALYAAEPVRGAIRARYEAGVPVAGVSAGALIAVRDCVLDRDETGGEEARPAPGLGLVDLVLQPHFTAGGRLPALLEAMACTRKDTGWGIDDAACMVFENERLARVLGERVYWVMVDVTAGTHRVERVPS